MRDRPAAASPLAVEIAGRRWNVAAHGHDISIPLRFNEAQPTFFGAPPASAVPSPPGPSSATCVMAAAAIARSTR
jgi:hypothetical protein